MSFARAVQLLFRLSAPAAEPRTPLPPGGDDLAATARALLHQVGCPALAERVVVRWNPRMRSTAGTANFRTATISLNPLLQPFGAAEVDLTLRHELAHLVAQHRAGQRRRLAPHGAEWRAACRDLGIAGESRCHTLPLPRHRRPRPFAYACPHCRLILTRTRPIRRKVACLPCCRAHNRGEYDDRFRLRPVRP